MTPQELKASILWNALQGKLTIQSENESVEEIIGKSSLSQLAEEECYFDIPGNWKWCKIKDVFTLVNGKAFKPTDWEEYGLPIVRIQNLNDHNSPFNYFAGEIEEKYLLNGGELLFSWSGTPGTSFGAFIWNGGKAVLNQHIFIVYPKFELDTKYAMYALNGELKIFIEKAHGGAGLKHITKKEFENCGLPIPPIAEQKRIVAKIEELLPLIDRYEQAWSRLEDFNKRFPADMQKSILQMAIQGRLVPQLPEEGTGEELFQQIQAEKQVLIERGEVYREKELSNISDDEIPFDIPNSWTWCKLGELTKTITKGSSPKWQGVSYTDKEHGILFVTSENVGAEQLLLSKEKYVGKGFNAMHPASILQKGDLLTNIVGASIGRTAVFDLDVADANINQAVCIIRLVNQNIADYVLKFLNSAVAIEMMTKKSVDSARANLSLTSVTNLLIPLPPLAEQKRIVAKLEEILPLCERLK